MEFRRDIPTLAGPSIDPTKDFISSERYLESLERKLNKVKGKNGEAANSKDMLKSLEKVRDNEMVQLMSGSTASAQSEDPSQYKGAVISKNHNSPQIEEVVALIYQDQLAKKHEIIQNDIGQIGNDITHT